jgi:NAD(P)-dependent dehydrogenase (short-subunit alcohol dehydrogenase family)
LEPQGEARIQFDIEGENAMSAPRLLENKHCVVTAGAHGLGYAIARLFAEQGGTVALCGWHASGEASAALLREISPDSFFLPCDMGDLAQVNAFGEAVLRRMGPVDVLINCVGINIREPVCDINMAHFDAVQTVNLKAALALTGKFVPVMIDQGIRGSVVNISSIHSMAPSAVTGAYAASKGGMNALSRVLALEVGRYGIRTNTLCCGWIATTGIFEQLNSLAGDREKQYAFLEEMHGTAPCISPARAEDIARHALFLASDRSAFITGATLMDDGGSTFQTHACTFPEPDDAYAMRKALYDAILDSDYTR